MESKEVEVDLTHLSMPEFYSMEIPVELTVVYDINESSCPCMEDRPFDSLLDSVCSKSEKHPRGRHTRKKQK